jgi:hypothetical protein
MKSSCFVSLGGLSMLAEEGEMKAVETRLEYCQRKAAEARTRADRIVDQDGRKMLLEVAAMWDEMADVAERSST